MTPSGKALRERAKGEAGGESARASRQALAGQPPGGLGATEGLAQRLAKVADRSWRRVASLAPAASAAPCASRPGLAAGARNPHMGPLLVLLPQYGPHVGVQARRDGTRIARLTFLLGQRTGCRPRRGAGGKGRGTASTSRNREASPGRNRGPSGRNPWSARPGKPRHSSQTVARGPPSRQALAGKP
jgi:hypothetical protein